MKKRERKDKLFACPKCPKRYASEKWMKRHLEKKAHGPVWIVYYSANLVKVIQQEIKLLREEIRNIKISKIIVSREFPIERIRKETDNNVSKEKNENKNKYIIVIEQLNIIFNTIKPTEEHNIRPSEIMCLKN